MGDNVALLIVDMQNEFMQQDRHIELAENIVKFSERYSHIALTRYVNADYSACNKQIGWKGCSPTTSKIELHKSMRKINAELVYDKVTYSAVNGTLLQWLNANAITEVHIVGIDTGCCVTATAYALFDMGIKIKVITDLCDSSNDRKRHEIAVMNLTTNVPVCESIDLI